MKPPASRTTPTSATPKTPAQPIPSSSSQTPSFQASAAIPTTSSSLPPMRLESSHRSPNSRPTRPCTTSSPDTPPSSPEPKPDSAANPSPNSQPASPPRSCHSRQRSTLKCLANASDSTTRNAGSSIPAGPEEPSAQDAA